MGALRRVVSLVPSLTEAIASVDADALIGVTDWCSHPSDLAAERVRGTKNPDVAKIISLWPEVVIANKEENRELDVRRLREAGVNVWVSEIENVPAGLDALREMFDDLLGWRAPAWLDEARQLWGGPIPKARARVVVPIWRDPWMVVGRDTFTGDLLHRAGLPHVFAEHGDRYPQMPVDQIDGAGADLALLPDEPYRFDNSDGPEAFKHTPCRLIEGRLITWYGPSLIEAHHTLATIGQ